MKVKQVVIGCSVLLIAAAVLLGIVRQLNGKPQQTTNVTETPVPEPPVKAAHVNAAHVADPQDAKQRSSKGKPESLQVSKPDPEDTQSIGHLHPSDRCPNRFR